MRIATEYLISHGWLLIPAALVGVILVAAGLFVLGGFEQNMCSGFTYFGFIDQKAVNDSYTIQLVNGNHPIIVTGIVAGTSSDSDPVVSLENVQPGNTFTIRTKPLGISPGTQFTNAVVRISYDIINGDAGKADTAYCNGRVA